MPRSIRRLYPRWLPAILAVLILALGTLAVRSAGGAEPFTPRKANPLRPVAAASPAAPGPKLAAAKAAQARRQCPAHGALVECRAALRRALQAVEWQRRTRRHLERRLQSFQRPVEHLAQWTCIHEREGAWDANTGNGYHGGLQMDWGFMRTYGSDMLARYGGAAELWTPRDQMVVAERAHDAGRGFHPWPNTARACGLL